MSRATKAYASAYQPGRVHESRIARGESRQYACDFNGALNGETVASARWANGNTAALTLSTLSQASGVVTVTALAVSSGWTYLSCEVTTSTGRKLSQQFEVDVKDHEPPSDATTLTWTA